MILKCFLNIYLLAVTVAKLLFLTIKVYFILNRNVFNICLQFP